jgi:hypothetical protein
MASLSTLIDTNTLPNPPNVKTHATSSCYEDVAHALTFVWNGSFGIVMSEQKCKIFNLRRVPTI